MEERKPLYESFRIGGEIALKRQVQRQPVFLIQKIAQLRLHPVVAAKQRQLDPGVNGGRQAVKRRIGKQTLDQRKPGRQIQKHAVRLCLTKRTPDSRQTIPELGKGFGAKIQFTDENIFPDAELSEERKKSGKR